MKKRNLGVALAVVLLCASCAHQSVIPMLHPPGFWMGLVHGAIAPIAFVLGLFSDVRIYAFPNSGGWYDLGFLLGIGAWGGGGAAASRRR
jgi:hypothetical protein